MKIININNVEELIMSKHDIETILSKNKTINDKMELNDFIKDIAAPTYIYMYYGQNILFKLYNINDNIFLFVVNDNPNEHKILIENLSKCKFNINNLKQIDNESIKNINDISFFIINNKYYI